MTATEWRSFFISDFYERIFYLRLNTDEVGILCFSYTKYVFIEVLH